MRNHVHAKDHDDDHAEDELGEIAPKARIDHRIVENVDGGEAHQNGNDRTASGHEAAETDNQGSQSKELKADAGVRADAVLTSRKQKSGQADNQASHDISEEHGQFDVDAAVPRRLSVAADRKDVPAEPRLPKHEKDQQRDGNQNQKADRHSKRLFEADPIPQLVAASAARDRDQPGLGRERKQSAHRDHGAERRQQRTAAHQSGQRAIDDAHQRTAGERETEHRPNRQAENVKAVECGERRHREVGADRQIDAANGDNNQQREDDQAAVGGVLGEIAQIGGGHIALGADDHAQDHDDEGNERNSALNPAFRQHVGQNAARREHKARHALTRQASEIDLH